MTEELHNCPEGLPAMVIGDVVVSTLDARAIAAMMEQIIAGNDVSSYAEEAQVVLDGIRGQIKETGDEQAIH